MLPNMPKKIKKKRKPKISSKVLILAGLFFLIIPVLFHINQTVQLMFFSPKVTAVQTIASPPISLAIPAVKMILPVEQTTITNGTWGISAKGVSHLSTSGRPTENGAIILYAHNTFDRFGPIRWLPVGKEIVLNTADGKSHFYVISKTFEVYPNQLEVFDQKTETLILYTCSGFADLKRFIVIATPKTEK